MQDNAIEVINLTRRFGDFTAVNSISFTVHKGEIFGFLGANGAGKSTTIRMLIGVLGITSGRGMVAGFDVGKNPDAVKKRIGYMSQKFSLYDDLTVMENILFWGGIYGVDRDLIEERATRYIDLTGLNGREKSLTHELSGGLKQRLALVCSLLHKPEIVFLDEPTSGVDPISRRHFWEIINTLTEEGATVLVTTHFLEEAEYCNRIILIHDGEIVAEGSPQMLKRDYIKHPILEIECDRAIEAMEILEPLSCINEISVFGLKIHADVEDAIEGERKIKEALAGQGIVVRKISTINPSLEDVFIHLVEKRV